MLTTTINEKLRPQKRNFISSGDATLDELVTIIQLAQEMKKDPLNKRWKKLLKNKTFLLLFYNPSLRTHLSFEKAVFQLGGNVHYRTPEMGWSPSSNKLKTGESIKDVARVMSLYADGIGIRLTLDAVSQQGEANKILHEFAHWSNVPIINMADDMYHPCQGLADLMGWHEKINAVQTPFNQSSLKGKKLLLTWARSGMARPWSSVQSHLLLAAKFGMDITLAHPKGYELDASVVEQSKEYCKKNNAEFEIINDSNSGYTNADVVYVRNWISNDAYKPGYLDYQNEVTKSLSFDQWMVTVEKMLATNNAIFANPMPVDRNLEVVDEIADGPNSVIYNVAENRMHVQKAILAKLLGEVF